MSFEHFAALAEANIEHAAKADIGPSPIQVAQVYALLSIGEAIRDLRIAFLNGRPG